METSRYFVVKFLLYDDVDEYVIVPKSWVWLNINEDAAVSYPKEIPAQTRKRVENNEASSRDWEIFRVTVIYLTDSYENALQAIQDLKNNTKINPNFIPPKADDLFGQLGDLFQNMTLGLDESSNNNSSPSTSKDANSKDKVKKENKNVEADAYNTPKRKLKSPYKKPVNCKLDDPKNTLRYPNLVELVPESNVYIDADELEKCKTSENRNQLILSLIKSIFTEKTLAMRLSTSPKDPKSGQEIKYTKVIKTILKFVDENDSEAENQDEKPKTITRYPKLTKPMPDSYVLANTKELGEAISSAKGSRKKLARGLMKAIFTEEALKNCSLSGEDPVAFDHNNADTRPGLDKTAVGVILKFVETIPDDGLNEWEAWDIKSVKKAMNNELEKWRSQ